ncbi:MAG: hypothetical protein MK101_11310 [Phycisphaerales bacterium]|nr:hypothetical protein [Phycisphaerales bacterium]
MKTVAACTSLLLVASAASGGGVTLLDQIGAADGSDITQNLYACQYFEDAYAVYDVAMVDDFDNSGGYAATSVSTVIGGWNGYAGLDAVQGAQVNFYNNLSEPSADLAGYISADFPGPLAGDPDWPVGSGSLLTFSGQWAINGDHQAVSVIPINEYGSNGQTGLHGSNLGDGASWQCNPGEGFGFGPIQDVAGNAAYRISGTEGDPCNANLPEECTADVSGTAGVPDYVVNVDDLLAVIANFGAVGDGTFRPTGDCAPLPSGDCTVNVDDVLMVISQFGTDCTPTGACCMGFNPCSVGTEDECAASGGEYAGDDTDCTTCAYGACCANNGSCDELLAEDCANSGGTFNEGITCSDAGCQPVVGACCLDAQSCLDGVTPDDCELFAGEFAGDGTSCTDAPCGWPGCSADDTPEGLPCQGDTEPGFTDENGGSNVDPPSFGSISDGETICGIMSTFTCIGCGDSGEDLTWRDTDWYMFDNPAGGTYTVRGGGNGPLVVAIVQISAGSFVDYALVEPYAQAEITVAIGAGNDYAVWVGHDWNAGYDVPCDSGQNDYTVSLYAADAPAAACCLGLECVGDLVPIECDALGGAYIGDQSCDTYQCPEAWMPCDTGYGQDPLLSGWWAGTSDSGTGYIRYANFPMTTISAMRVWGITGVYSGGWSACYEEAMSFDVVAHADNGAGAPGDITGELIDYPADQAAIDVDFGSWTLRRFDFPLQSSSPNTWIKVASNGNNCWFLWVASSEENEGDSLLENGGAFETVPRALSICITP